MIETGVVIGLDRSEIHWHLPPDRSMGYLPDQHDLWEVLWGNREKIRGFAHSHPGSGTPFPSETDITTFQAVENGLGRRLCWWITSADTLVAFHWTGEPTSEPESYLGTPEPDLETPQNSEFHNDWEAIGQIRPEPPQLPIKTVIVSGYRGYLIQKTAEPKWVHMLREHSGY